MPEPTRKSWETWHLVVAAVLALLIGVAIGAAVNNDDDGPGDAAAALMNTAPAIFPSTSAPPATGTRPDPIPLASDAELDDWTIKVVETQPDAWHLIAAEDPGNAPPAPGHQYYVVHIAMTYTGSQASQRSDVRFSTVGESSVAYGDDASCGVVPNALSSVDVPSGGTITGNLCWSVTTADAANLLLVAEGAAGSGDPLFLALD